MRFCSGKRSTAVLPWAQVGLERQPILCCLLRIDRFVSIDRGYYRGRITSVRAASGTLGSSLLSLSAIA